MTRHEMIREALTKLNRKMGRDQLNHALRGTGQTVREIRRVTSGGIGGSTETCIETLFHHEFGIWPDTYFGTDA